MEVLQQKIVASSIPEPMSGCWLWEKGLDHLKKYGYTWYNNKNIRAHRASYLAFNGEIPNGLFVLHKCDNPKCVNPQHLFLGTNEDNLKDMAAKGRSCRGELNKCGKHGKAKLTEADVLAIRKDTRLTREIAKQYGIDRSYAGVVRSGKSWRHLK